MNILPFYVYNHRYIFYKLLQYIFFYCQIYYCLYNFESKRSYILIRPMPVIFKINVRIFLVLTTRSRVAIFRKREATIEKVTVRLPIKKTACIVIRP